jgi:hypothetical protein
MEGGRPSVFAARTPAWVIELLDKVTDVACAIIVVNDDIGLHAPFADG